MQRPAHAGIHLTTLITLGLAGALQAQTVHPVERLLPSIGLNNDEFGRGLAFDGDTAVIGAGAGYPLARVGQAFVFVRSGSGWSEQQRLVPSDGSLYATFGRAVGVSGDTAIVGAFGQEGGGAAYVFVRSGTTWTEQQKLVDDAANRHDFGFAVAVQGDMALVSHPSQGSPARGAVLVFKRTDGVWTLSQRLFPSDSVAGDWFGHALAWSGDTAVIGAPQLGQASPGRAYVFTYGGTTWSQQARIVATDGAARDLFGFSVAVAGDSAVVGAPGHDAAALEAGAAYVFTRSGATWTQQAKLAGRAQAGVAFGHSVAIQGERCTVGAPNPPQTAPGSAHLFVRESGAWSELAVMQPGPGQGLPADMFGYSAAMSADTTMLGARAPSAGAVHVFEHAPDPSRLLVGTTSADELGQSVAASGRLLVAGAPGYDGELLDQGAVHVLEDTSLDGDWSSFTRTRLVAGTGLASELGTPHYRARFGDAVAVRGDTIVVGAPGWGAAQSQEGRAFVFRRVGGIVSGNRITGGTWERRAALLNPAPGQDQGFGAAVAIGGPIETIAVGQHQRHATSFERAPEVKVPIGGAPSSAPALQNRSDITAWGFEEELVGPDYRTNIGFAARSADAARRGGHSLLVHANAHRLANASNHVIGQRLLLPRGVVGKWRYEFAFYVPVTSDPDEIGQTGPEWSIQSTRRIGEGYYTHTSGLQYVRNPGDTARFGTWNIWTTHSTASARSGLAQWRGDLTPQLNDGQHRVQPGSWYQVVMDVDYSDGVERYLSLTIRGPGMGTSGEVTLDLGAIVVERELKPGFDTESLFVSVEAENQYAGITREPPITRHFRIYYDDVRLTSAEGKAFAFERRDPLLGGEPWLGDLQPQGELRLPSPQPFSAFGAAVAVTGSGPLPTPSIAVGAPRADGASLPQTGAVHLFERPLPGWAAVQPPSATMLASDAARGDRYGEAVALRGAELVVGAPGDDDANPADIDCDSGAVYAYRRGAASFGLERKLRAADAATADGFGRSLALWPGRLLVGAPEDGLGAGSAHGFVDLGAGWEEPRALAATAAKPGDGYATSVALSGQSAIAGAPAADGFTPDGGGVHRHPARLGRQRAITLGGEAVNLDWFGSAVAIDGDVAVVGAPNRDDQGFNSGAAYVLLRTAGVWTVGAKLLRSDGTTGDQGGRTVAIAGDTIAVGVPFDDHAPGPVSDAGAVYVYRRPAGGWSGTLYEEARLVASDARAEMRFGDGLAMAGDTIAVVGVFDVPRVYVFQRSAWSGTSSEDAVLTAWNGGYTRLDVVATDGQTLVAGSTSPLDPRQILVFERPATGWANATEGARLGASALPPYVGFPQRLAIDGGTIVAAPPFSPAGINPGWILVYTRPAGGWRTANEDARLVASDGEHLDYLGSSLAVEGDLIAAAAPLDDDGLRCEDANGNSGAVYLFRRPASGWANGTEAIKLLASDGVAGDQLGVSLALDGSTLFAGAPRADHAGLDAGAAYVFELPFTPTRTGADVVVAPIDAATGESEVTLTFSSVTAGGSTTVTTGSVDEVLPTGFALGDPPTAWNIETSAGFAGTIQICIDYGGVAFVDESRLALLHYENGQWIDVTTSIDTVNDRIYGTVSSLSPFAVAQRSAEQFAAFDIKLEVDRRRSPGRFDLKAKFEPGAASNGVDPASEGLTIEFGAFRASIAPAALRVLQRGPHRSYVFTGPAGGATLDLRLDEHAGQRFHLRIDGRDIDLSGLPSQVDVVLRIGDDVGTARVAVRG